jgi:hypothetical protein
MVDQGLLIIKTSRLHWDTPHSVGLLWTSDQSDAETSTWQHTTLKEKDIHVSGGIQTHNSSKRSAADPRLRPRGHWDRLTDFLLLTKFYIFTIHLFEFLINC